MKASVLYAPRTPMVVEDISIDKPKAREVLVKVSASGLCHSDLHFINGDLPFDGPTVFGHEVAGVVEAIGPEVTSVRIGDHVVACASGFCGGCADCVSERSHLCAHKPVRAADDAARLHLDGAPVAQGVSIGGFAEQILVHENWLVRISRDVPLDRAALLGCAVVTGLGSVFNAAKVTPGSSVAVIGCGGVGLNVIQGARIAGAERIIAIDLSPEKLALAKKLGATDGIAGGPDAVATVKQLTGGGVDFVFEVIGLAKTIEQGIGMLRPRGLLSLVGATGLDTTVALPTFATLINEFRIQGAMMGSAPFVRDIPRFAQMYLDGKLDLDNLLAERIDLTQIDAGYEKMKLGNQARSVIVFN